MTGTLILKDELAIDNILDNTRTLVSKLMNNDELTVDITGVTKVDMAAIQMLIAAKKECEANGKKLVVKTSGEVNDMLFFMGLQL
jgi:anti-anti-sigma regulatory factor